MLIFKDRTYILWILYYLHFHMV